MVAEFEIIGCSRLQITRTAEKAFQNHLKVQFSIFEKLNPPSEDGFPKVKELSSGKVFVANAKDPNFDRPISELEKEY
jgi:hypothetical protein